MRGLTLWGPLLGSTQPVPTILYYGFSHPNTGPKLMGTTPREHTASAGQHVSLLLSCECGAELLWGPLLGSTQPVPANRAWKGPSRSTNLCLHRTWKGPILPPTIQFGAGPLWGPASGAHSQCLPKTNLEVFLPYQDGAAPPPCCRSSSVKEQVHL